MVDVVTRLCGMDWAVSGLRHVFDRKRSRRAGGPSILFHKPFAFRGFGKLKTFGVVLTRLKPFFSGVYVDNRGEGSP